MTAAAGNAHVKVFRRRWLVLAAFCLLTMMNSVQWVQYTTVADSVGLYYGVSSQAVDWLSIVYMLTYLPFVVPASWMLDNKGLRTTVLLAGVLNCVAAWIKVASVQPDPYAGYAVTMLGQTLAGITQAFVLAVPARLAGVWFGPGEVSTACGIGVFGNQVGTAFGFAIPPLIIKFASPMETLGSQISIVHYVVAAVCTASLVLLFFVFQDAPPVPPSFAQAQVLSGRHTPPSARELVKSMLRMVRTPGFVLLLVSYGISVGVFYAISTVLQHLVLSVFPDRGEDAGNIGLLLVVAGLVGSVLSGIVLDATRKYKEVSLVVYFLSLIGMAAFAASFFAPSIWAVYLTSCILGFFLTGYLPLGFEFAVELTYPEPEGTSAGLLNVSAQVFGLIFSELSGLPLANKKVVNGHLWVNASLSIALLVGVVLTALVPSNLKRQSAMQQGDQGPPAPKVLK